MKYFFKYLKTVFVDKWWIYIAFVPNIVSIIQTYISRDYNFQFPLSYSIIWFISLLLIANYKAWIDLYNPIERPKVIIDYDLDDFGVCFLVIKNIGNQHARDVHISFSPNIIPLGSKKTKLNERSFMNQPLITMGTQSRFLFGSFQDDKNKNKILREFIVLIHYWDENKNREYKESQIIDPRQYLETSPKKTPEYVIKESIEKLDKSVKSLLDIEKKRLESWKEGVLIRNNELTTMKPIAKMLLLKNLIIEGNEEDTTINPYVYDFEHLVVSVRRDLLLKKNLNTDEKDLLSKLNLYLSKSTLLGMDRSKELEEISSLASKLTK